MPPLITSIVKQQQAGSGASGTPGFKTGFHIKDALFTKILIYDREEGGKFYVEKFSSVKCLDLWHYVMSDLSYNISSRMHSVYILTIHD